MPAGGGIGNLLMAALPLIGIVTMLRARSRRKSGKDAPDRDLDESRASALEVERRMASYLASRDQRSWHDDA